MIPQYPQNSRMSGLRALVYAWIEISYPWCHLHMLAFEVDVLSSHLALLSFKSHALLFFRRLYRSSFDFCKPSLRFVTGPLTSACHALPSDRSCCISYHTIYLPFMVFSFICVPSYLSVFLYSWIVLQNVAMTFLRDPFSFLTHNICRERGLKLNLRILDNPTLNLRKETGYNKIFIAFKAVFT